MSNACLFVNHVLHRCLKAIGVHAIKIYGVYKTGSLKNPHVWLDIEGHVVDNTFVEGISETFFKTNKESATYMDTSVKEEKGLYLGDHVSQRYGIEDHNVATCEWMLSNEDNGLALFKNKLQ